MPAQPLFHPEPASPQEHSIDHQGDDPMIGGLQPITPQPLYFINDQQYTDGDFEDGYQGGDEDGEDDHDVPLSEDLEAENAMSNCIRNVFADTVVPMFDQLHGDINDLKEQFSTFQRRRDLEEQEEVLGEVQGEVQREREGRGGRERRKPRAAKPYAGPRRRDPVKVMVANAVRASMLARFGGTRPTSHLITRAQAQRYNDDYDKDPSSCRPCCTIDDFSVDTRNSAKSGWNVSACRVFTDAFLPAFQQKHPDVTEDMVHNAFYAHFNTIKKGVASFRMTPEGRIAHQKLARRAQRKRALFGRRIQIAEIIPEAQKHVEILTKLGVDGMSSDESDIDTPGAHGRAGDPVFRILVPIWHAQEVTPWLRTLDQAHLVTREMGNAVLNRGAPPRMRVDNPNQVAYSQKTRSYRAELPWNAYRPEWLAARVALWAIRPGPENKPYDFTHHAQIHQFITQDLEDHLRGRRAGMA